MKLKELVDEIKSIANEGKMDATDSTLFVEIVAEAWDRLEGMKNALWIKEIVERNLGDWRQVSEILERIVKWCDARGRYVSPEELEQLIRFSEGLKHTIYEFHRYSQKRACAASPERIPDIGPEEGRGMSGRTASILISEIGHDLDEIVTGWSQKEEALIEVGINDTRRDLEELSKLIAEAAA